MPHATSVLIAHDDATVGDRVCSALKDEFRILPPVTKLEALEPASARLAPDTVLLGLMWRDIFLLPRLRDLVRYHSATRFCVYSRVAAPSIVRDAIQAGAAGYLVRPATRSDIVGAIECAQGGVIYLQRFLHPAILSMAKSGHFLPGTPVAPLLPIPPDSPDYAAIISWLVYDLRLTPRQAEVALAIRDGVPEKRIALRIACSLATVRKHVRAVYFRLSHVRVTNHGSLGALVERSLGHRPVQWRPEWFSSGAHRGGVESDSNESGELDAAAYHRKFVLRAMPE